MSLTVFPPSLLQYVLDFNSRKERGIFHRVCSKFHKCNAWENVQLLSKIRQNSVRVDLSIKNALAQLSGISAMLPMPAPTVFRFPENSHIILRSGKSVDVSHVHFDISEISGNWGSLTYCSRGNTFIARTMDTIGHSGSIYNLPICIAGRFRSGSVEMLSKDNAILDVPAVQEMLKEALKRKFTKIHCVLHFNGHVSLASITVKERVATLTFYDSLSPKILSYQERYTEDVVNFIKELLPDSLTCAKPHEVVHILDQGTTMMWGGYYALYTALLLTRNEDKGLLDLFLSLKVKIFEEARDGLALRVDLIVRTLLDFGIDKVQVDDYSFFMDDEIFSKVPNQLPTIVNQLKERV